MQQVRAAFQAVQVVAVAVAVRARLSQVMRMGRTQLTVATAGLLAQSEVTLQLPRQTASLDLEVQVAEEVVVVAFSRGLERPAETVQKAAMVLMVS